MAHARFESAALLAIDPKALGIAFLLPESRANQRIGPAEIVSITGPLTSRDGGIWDSYESIKQRVQQACLSDATVVALSIESPGGEAHSVYETSRQIRAMCEAAGKTLIACIDAQGCSAAYALASAATQIVATETSTVGSIGVITAREDVTEAMARQGIKVSYVASGAKKIFGNPETQESDQERLETQRQVNNLAAMFYQLIEQHRAIPAAQVAMQEGGTFIGQEAVQAGLVDRVGTLESVLGSIDSPPLVDDPGNPSEVQAVTFAEICEALAGMAGSEDESAKLAAKMLEALAETPAPEDKPEDAPADDPEDEPEEDKPAASAVKTAAALAQQLEAAVAENKTLRTRLDGEAKAKYFAEHQVSEQLRAVLEPKPLAEIEAIVAAMAVKPEPRKGLATVKTIQGPRQGSPLALQGKERAELDAAMGLRPAVQAEQSTPYRQVFSRQKAVQ